MLGFRKGAETLCTHVIVFSWMC